MSRRELERVEVMGRVASGGLRLTHAAEMLGLSYRKTKRLWGRYREQGGEGLKHGNAGRDSNRGKPKKLRRGVLRLIRKEYSGSEAERFGPTLAAEHLADHIFHRFTRPNCSAPPTRVGLVPTQCGCLLGSQERY